MGTKRKQDPKHYRYFTVYLSKVEASMVKRQAKNRGLSVSAYFGALMGFRKK